MRRVAIELGFGIHFPCVNAELQARLQPSPEAGCLAFPTTCKCGRPLEGYETTCCKFCMNTPNAKAEAPK